MSGWIDDLRRLDENGVRSVIVTVAGVRGSAPREAGAKMFVTATETIGSIGGGQLEYGCARMAFDLLESEEAAASLRRFPLGTSMGQCCGGVVDILFEPAGAIPAEVRSEMWRLYRSREPFVVASSECAKALITHGDEIPRATFSATVLERAREMIAERHPAAVALHDVKDRVLLEPVSGSGCDIAVFGAGHVGAAVVRLLADTDFSVRWIDSRRRIFPQHVPDNVVRIEARQPVSEIAAMGPGAFYLVLTHSHALDFEICSGILARGDFAYCGLIGSRTKRRRFEKRMLQQGLPQSVLDELTCPIGIDGIEGKAPQDIAIATAAQLMVLRDARSCGTAGSGRLHLIERQEH
jgi:xanthine dehydrogenase accessory factor